jgi:RNA polymerase sigma factor (TIGR02999 family)
VSESRDITSLLNDGNLDQIELMNRLFPVVYQELHRIAHKQLKKSWSVETICTTALVNEAWIKLAKGPPSQLANRSHFFAIAAKAMRQILINYAEERRAVKRGGDWQKTTLDEALKQPESNLQNLLAIDSALTKIESIDASLVALVEMRFFAGMTETEIAEALGVTDRTVRRNWIKAKALLARMLESGSAE